MSTPRSIALVLFFVFVAPLASAAASEPQVEAKVQAAWARAGAELEVVLRHLDPLPRRWPNVTDPGHLASTLDEVLTDWRSRRDVPQASGARSDAPPIPDVVIAALQRIRHGVERSRRPHREGEVTAFPDTELAAQVRELRLLAAKRHGGTSPTAPQQAVALSAPPNDDCSAATPITAGTFIGTTLEATNDGSATCGSSGGSPDVWFVYTAPSTGEVSFDTFGSTYDTVLSLHTGCPGSTANQVQCNDDWFGLQSRVVASLTAGQQIRVRVSGFNGQAGDFVLHVATGILSGTVTDSSTADPLPGVTIEIYDSTGSFVSSAITDTDGTYESQPVPDGDYFARTISSDHQDELYDDLPCLGFCSVLNGTAITVGAGADSSGIDFALDPGGAIAGTVTDASDGSPLAFVTVWTIDSGGQFVKSGTTAADGTYRVGGLPGGSYRARAFSSTHLDELYDDIACHSGCNLNVGTAIAVTVGADSSGVDFALELGGSIGGTVIDLGSGTPLGGLILEIYNSTGSLIAFAFTASNGSYSRGDLPSGNYFVRSSSPTHLDELFDDIDCDPQCGVTAGTPVAVVQGAETSGIDFALRLLGSVFGTIRETVTGSPLAGVPVTAYDLLGRPQSSTDSDFDGSYFLVGLHPGHYGLLAGPSSSHATQLLGGFPFGLDVTLGAVFASELGTTAGPLDLDLPPLGACGFPEALHVSGKVFSSTVEIVACSTLAVGPVVAVGGGGGRLVLRAGDSVALRSSFLVLDQARLDIGTGPLLPPPEGDVFYREDFDDGFALGWDTSNGATDLWRLDPSDCSAPPSGATTLTFSRSAPDCDYDLAETPVGWARSPTIDLSSALNPTLRVTHRWATEGGGFFDRMQIEVSPDGGATWTPIWTDSSASSAGFVTHDLDVSSFATSSFRIRLSFDARDEIFNDFTGWHVDEVSVRTD